MREEHPYQGTASYFRNVQRQHQPRPALPAAAASEQAAAGEGGGGSEGWTLVDQAGAEASASSSTRTSASHSSAGGATPQGLGGAEGEADASCRVPVTCINLLHANPKKASELMLSSHFQDVSLLCLSGCWWACGAPSLVRRCVADELACALCCRKLCPANASSYTACTKIDFPMVCRPCATCGGVWAAARPSRWSTLTGTATWGG